ncbi:hypothetical protein C7C46_32655 [Streptomyces tateyamensis]|uniref:Uncharacterized protein n=1 Tax=Streptomyces tateyamensis TaxID=565073 RepID=A0A2V4MWC8_9ACTN|nr:hypothetical protein [Streptomyces tateyamensis]PYC65345.1 hypothetical protein C7C46_32655 [Streptomyces tateyamensis]
MTAQIDPKPTLPTPRVDRTAWVLVGAALAWGLILLVLAAVLPIVTVQGSVVAPATPSSSTGNTGALVGLPRVTLVQHDGYGVLLLVALPTVLSLLVGLLLWLWGTGRFTAAGAAAWIVAGAVLAGGIVGFVTFLIGIAVVPTGVLLLCACVRAAPLSGSRPSAGHPSR